MNMDYWPHLFLFSSGVGSTTQFLFVTTPGLEDCLSISSSIDNCSPELARVGGSSGKAAPGTLPLLMYTRSFSNNVSL